MGILRNHVSPKSEHHGAENACQAGEISTTQPDIAQTKREPSMQKHPELQRLEQDMATRNVDSEKQPDGGIEQRRLNISRERDTAIDRGVPKWKASVADCLKR